MNVRSIFFTRHAELRFGWRMLLFVLITGVVGVSLLVSLSVVGLQGETSNALAVCVSLLTASYVMTRAINRKPLKAVGLGVKSGALRELALGLLLGFLMMAGIFLVEYAAGWSEAELRILTTSELAELLGFGFLSYLFAAAAEELLFRGYPFQTLMQGITFLPAAVLTSTLFAFAHAANPNITWFALANIALAGIWLSFAYLKTRRLWFPIGLHFAWNFTQTTLCGFPTSGIQPDARSLLVLTQTGPDFVTGGTFGPEGGILATIALLLSTWHIIKSSLYQTMPGTVTLDSLEDLIPEYSGNGSKG